MKEVLIATNNAHKVEEIRTALNFEGWMFTTLAEVSQAEKNGISHRGNALRVLKKALSQSVDER